MRRLEFASLQVMDLEASTHFYTTKLGFEPAGIPNPDACVFKFGKGDASFAIRKPLANLDGRELGVGTSLWFAIDEDIQELRSRLLEKEVTLIGAVNETPFGRTIMAKDPDGYIITFLKANP